MPEKPGDRRDSSLRDASATTHGRHTLLPRLLAATGLCLVLAAAHASAVQPATGPPAGGPVSVSKAVRDRLREEGNVRVLVELRLGRGAFVSEGRLDRASVAAQRRDIADKQTRVLERLDSKPHRLARRFSSVPFVALEVESDGLRELENARELVGRVVVDDVVYASLDDSVPIVQADRLWAQGFDGTGKVVAVLDTGVSSSHPFLQGKVVEEACYSSTVPPKSTTLCPNGQEEQIGPGSGVNCPLSLFGCDHGTHVAGIAAGNGSNLYTITTRSARNTPRACAIAAIPCGATANSCPCVMMKIKSRWARAEPPSST